MLCLDVNVLLNAVFDDSADSELARRVSADAFASGAGIGILSEVGSAFVRLSTNRRAFTHPLEPEAAVACLDALLAQPHVRLIQPGPSHWSRFRQFVLDLRLRDTLVPDAWLAAASMSVGATLVSFDRDFARFPGLRWVDPAHP